MEISVIIPTYKPGKYINECLLSLKNQTLDSSLFEIVIVLNGCNDPWHKDLKDFISLEMENINILLIQEDKGGVSNARNIALKIAKGKYVMFLDDDDYISKTTLSDLYYKTDGESVVIFKPLAFYDGNPPFSYSRTVEYESNYTDSKVPFYKVKKNFSGPVMKLIPSSVISGHEYNLHFKNGEDSLFMFLISDKMNNVVFAPPTAIYYRRIRKNSASTNKKSYWSVIKNSFLLIKEYTIIYLNDMSSYNLLFYITRVLGACKAILYAHRDTF